MSILTKMMTKELATKNESLMTPGERVYFDGVWFIIIIKRTCIFFLKIVFSTAESIKKPGLS